MLASRGGAAPLIRAGCGRGSPASTAMESSIAGRSPVLREGRGRLLRGQCVSALCWDQPAQPPAKCSAENGGSGRDPEFSQPRQTGPESSTVQCMQLSHLCFLPPFIHSLHPAVCSGCRYLHLCFLPPFIHSHYHFQLHSDRPGMKGVLAFPWAGIKVGILWPSLPLPSH